MRKPTATAIAMSFLLLAPLGASPVFAQVAQWNQVVVDWELRSAFYRALREVSVAYIDEVEAAGIAGTITFVDHQLDYPLQLTSSRFRNVTLNAAQSKAAYLLNYQAKTTAGTRITITRKPVGLGVIGLQQAVGEASYGGVAGAEILGDGGMMLCPVNRSGLEFMMGALAVATIGENGAFRSEEDGDAIIELHAAILERTYELYGSAPPTDE